MTEPESLEASIEGSGTDRCELGCLLGRKGSRGTTDKSLAVLEIGVENDGVRYEASKEELYEDGRVISIEVDVDSGLIVGGWFVRCGPACTSTADDGVVVEGTVDGVSYGFGGENSYGFGGENGWIAG